LVLFPVLVVLLGLARSYFRGGLHFGPSNIEVIESYQPNYASLREKIGEHADELQAHPPVEEFVLISQPSNTVVIDANNADETNSALLPLSAYTNLGENHDHRSDDALVFKISNDPLLLASCLAWTSDQNPLHHSLRNKDGSKMDRRLARGLTVRYLFLGRIHWDRFQDEKSIGKAIRGDVFLVDLESDAILAKIPVEGPPVIPLKAYPFLQFHETVIDKIAESLNDAVAIRL
jgi:hypothetical protein